MTRGPLTGAERRLRTLLVAHAILSALLAAGYVVAGDTSVFAFIANSFAKDALFVVVSVLGAADVRRRGWLALVVAAGYGALVAGQVATLAWGGIGAVDVLGTEVAGSTVVLAWMAVDLVLAAWFVVWWAAAVRAARGLRYLHPVAFLGLEALAEVLIDGRDEVLPPAQVAHNVDGYLATLRAGAKARVHLALAALTLWPLLTLRPPLPALSADGRRRFLERRLLADVSEGRVPRPLRGLVRAVIRTGSQMTYLGYYGDRRSWPSIGYVPYAGRPGAHVPAPGAERPGRPLRSLGAAPQRRYDTIVIGSGAAGGILAHRFAEAGRRVLVVERGPHADPATFTDDEVGQYLRLYNEGALQLATDFGLQVLQGMCVGGSTTINNALCLDPPDAVLEAWAERGIDPVGLRVAIGDVRAWLDVTPIRPATTSPAARRFAEAVTALGLPGRLEVMSANIAAGCRGCGSCNLGCAYGAKLSTLDAVLPWAQERHGLDVLADAEVERIVHEAGHAGSVLVRRPGGERLALQAREIVVAAGAIGSSAILARSGLGGEGVGRNLHFNVVSPLTAEFPEPVDAYAGIQMSHAYAAGDGVPAYLIETWFNPPATQALVMPGWFGDHFAHMLRYRHMASAGVLVGTTTPGRVRVTRKGAAIDFRLADADRERMLDGLRVAGRVYLRAGATAVMPATFALQRYTSPGALDALPERIRRSGDLVLSSAHPQGGNALGDVVDAGFRVRGARNVYVCDASVFPTSVHVNPQLTVMGLAQYAAARILAGDGPPRVTRLAPVMPAGTPAPDAGGGVPAP